MLSLEQKYLLDCMKNNFDSVLSKSVCNFSFEKLLHELCDQKLLLNLYPKLKEYIPDKYQKKFGDVYIYFLYRRMKLLKFQKKFIEFLNNLKLKFIVLKGLANEIIAHKNENYRIFGDLDILMTLKSIELLKISLPNSGFDIKRLETFDDYYQHEIRIQINYKNELYIVEIKRRHREANYKLTNKFFKNFFLYKNRIDNLEMPILNKEMFYISSCLYLYNYMERIDGWLYSSKIKICYYYDLYQFIIKNNFEISFKLLLFCLRFKILHKVLLITKYVYDIFMDEKIYNLYRKLNKYCYKHYENDFVDSGRIYWNISIVDRLFNYKEISEFLKKYAARNFYLGNLKYQKNVGYRKLGNNKENLKYKISVLDQVMYIRFKNININFKDNNLIYISLFCNNMYGIYKFPFEPISIRIHGSDIKIYNRFTVNDSAFLFENENYMNYQNRDAIKYKFYNKKLDVIIDSKYLNSNFKKSEIIGYSIELGKIDLNGKLNIIDRTNDIKDRPLVIKI